MDYLFIRHADAQEGSDDFTRSLSAKGFEQMQLQLPWIYQVLTSYKQVVFYYSPALRTSQCKTILGFDTALPLAALYDENTTLQPRALPHVQADLCCVIAHNPGIERLVQAFTNTSFSCGKADFILLRPKNDTYEIIAYHKPKLSLAIIPQTLTKHFSYHLHIQQVALQIHYQHFMQEGSAESLHQYRLALRKSKTLLKYSPHPATYKKTIKELKHLYQTLSTLRDLDLLLQYDQDKQQATLQKQREQLYAICKQLNPIELPLENSSMDPHAFVHLVHHQYQQYKAMKHLEKLTPEHLHKLRIKGKECIHLIDCYAPFEMKKQRKKIKKLNDLLGTYHDFVILAQHPNALKQTKAYAMDQQTKLLQKIKSAL